MEANWRLMEANGGLPPLLACVVEGRDDGIKALIPDMDEPPNPYADTTCHVLNTYYT